MGSFPQLVPHALVLPCTCSLSSGPCGAVPAPSSPAAAAPQLGSPRTKQLLVPASPREDFRAWLLPLRWWLSSGFEPCRGSSLGLPGFQLSLRASSKARCIPLHHQRCWGGEAGAAWRGLTARIHPAPRGALGLVYSTAREVLGGLRGGQEKPGPSWWGIGRWISRACQLLVLGFPQTRARSCWHWGQLCPLRPGQPGAVV